VCPVPLRVRVPGVRQAHPQAVAGQVVQVRSVQVVGALSVPDSRAVVVLQVPAGRAVPAVIQVRLCPLCRAVGAVPAVRPVRAAVGHPVPVILRAAVAEAVQVTSRVQHPVGAVQVPLSLPRVAPGVPVHRPLSI